MLDCTHKRYAVILTAPHDAMDSSMHTYLPTYLPLRSGPSKGSRPLRIANKITPRDHTSSGGPALAVSWNTSGARKDRVPQLDFMVAPGR